MSARFKLHSTWQLELDGGAMPTDSDVRGDDCNEIELRG